MNRALSIQHSSPPLKTIVIELNTGTRARGYTQFQKTRADGKTVQLLFFLLGEKKNLV